MTYKNIYSIFAASLALLATSCEKCEPTTNNAANGGGDGIFVTITVDPAETRVGVDGKVTEWCEGDVMRLYNSSSLMANDVNMVTAAQPDADSGAVSFSGTLDAALAGGKVEGIYPGTNIGEGILMNNANVPLNEMSKLRVMQPAYFKYMYDAEGSVTPESLGDYCYLHFISNETLSGVEGVAELTGTVSHLMSYLTFNLTNVASASKVERIYIKAEKPLVNEGINITEGGVVEYDQSLDYIGMANGLKTQGSGDDGDMKFGYKRLGGFDIDYFVFELSAEDSTLGVAVADGELTFTMPIIPQTLSGEWSIYVVYADGSESIATINHSGTTEMEAGKSYNDEETIALGAAASATPKVGDFYFADGSYSTSLVGAASDPVGMVYKVKGSGAETAMDKVFRLRHRKDAHTATAYCNITNKKNDAFTTKDFATSASVVVGQGQINMMETMTLAMNGSTLGADKKTPISTTLQGLNKATYIKDILEEVSPALYNILMLNEAKFDNVVDATLADANALLNGSLRDFWYLPSIDESYEMIVSILAVSAHNDYFVNSRLSTLPEEFTGDVVNLGTALDNSFDDGTYFNFFVPHVGATYFSRNSTMTAGSVYGLKSRPLHYFSPSSSDYITHQPWGVVNNAQPSRAILIVGDK